MPGAVIGEIEPLRFVSIFGMGDLSPSGLAIRASRDPLRPGASFY
jgi:hypothetical protein